ncbi:hypothetical protein [Nocardia wallacei]|uniref:hypothetical protein n=1 Tax=Nocardia wallacei TaxID=480035 RepID=UPI002455302E|nr:hypothetical protein [Nocardia wallacei]
MSAPYGLPVTNHAAIPVMTVEYAHVVMQIHMECPISVCPLKSQARLRLVEAGHLAPADRPKMGY